MKYKTHILALDPSGNFHEGKGTTGWVLMDTTQKLITRGLIYAENYNSVEEYWDAHIDLLQYNIDRHGDALMVIIEDYQLYANRAENQINSKMETCRLIGLLQWYCWNKKQPYLLENASTIKTRWSDDVLLQNGIIYYENNRYFHLDSGYEMSNHTRDAMRHALHFINCIQTKPERNIPKPRAHKLQNYERSFNERPDYKTRRRQSQSSSSSYGNHKRHSTRTRVWQS